MILWQIGCKTTVFLITPKSNISVILKIASKVFYSRYHHLIWSIRWKQSIIFVQFLWLDYYETFFFLAIYSKRIRGTVFSEGIQNFENFSGSVLFKFWKIKFRTKQSPHWNSEKVSVNGRFYDLNEGLFFNCPLLKWWFNFSPISSFKGEFISLS